MLKHACRMSLRHFRKMKHTHKEMVARRQAIAFPRARRAHGPQDTPAPPRACGRTQTKEVPALLVARLRAPAQRRVHADRVHADRAVPERLFRRLGIRQWQRRMVVVRLRRDGLEEKHAELRRRGMEWNLYKYVRGCRGRTSG